MKKIDSINLLPETSKFKASRQKLIKKLNKYAVAAVVVLITAVVVVFGYQFYLKRTKNKLVSEKKSLNQSIAQFDYHLELQQRLRFRLKMVSELLDSRTDNSLQMENLVSFLPVEVKAENIKIDSRTIKFKGGVNNLIEIKELEEKINLARKSGNYSQIKLESLSREIEGWTFQLTLEQ